MNFSELQLPDHIMQSINELGFEKPTDVQAQSIPLAIEGNDLVVQSRTGSGKTASFAIPIATKIHDSDLSTHQALILTPTRELALQVERECAKIGAFGGLTTTAIYGGASIGPQIDTLKQGVQLIVATPGRILDHIQRKTFNPSSIRFVVLDEADEMLSMGFLEDINKILEAMPEKRQTFLFSATLPADIERLSKRYLTNPQELLLSEDFVGVHEIDHIYYRVDGGNRTADLLSILKFEDPKLALIFCNTRDDTAFVAQFLINEGFAAEGISSDLTQKERERVMNRMRAGELRYLVATDIAARGIDIANVTHVFNYSFPENADVYIHRTGRTGRAGQSGRAISLVAPKEIGSFYYLKLIHKIYPTERSLPNKTEAATRREATLFEGVKARYQNKSPNPVAFDVAKRLLSTIDGERLIACCLEELFEKKPADLDSSSSQERTAAPQKKKKPTQRKEKAPRGYEAESNQDSITTAEGDVEFFEVLDAESSKRSRKKRRRTNSKESENTKDMSRLYINVGRRHNIDPEALTSFFQIKGDLKANTIGPVSQHDRHSFIYLKEECVDSTINKLNNEELLGHQLTIERAKSNT